MRNISSPNWFGLSGFYGAGFRAFPEDSIVGNFGDVFAPFELPELFEADKESFVPGVTDPHTYSPPTIDPASLQLLGPGDDEGDPTALGGNDETNGTALAQDTILIAGVDFVGDHDQFEITLTDGVEYTISVEGISLQRGNFALFDSNGNQVGTATLVGAYTNYAQRAELVITAPTGGAASDTYTLVVASASSSDTGSYAVSFAETASPIAVSGTDTIAGDTSTTASVAVGEVFTGQLNSDADTDWVAVTLTAGQWYSADLSGVGGASSVGDPLVSVFDANGNLVTTNDDELPGTITYSRAIFQATTTGTYYIQADAFSGNGAAPQTGNYALQVNTTTAPALVDSVATNAILGQTVIDVYLAGDGEAFSVPGGETWTSLGWDTAGTAAVQAALDVFSLYSNLTFNIVNSAASADWILTTYSEAADPVDNTVTLGRMFFPGPVQQFAQFNTNADANWNAGSLAVGGSAFTTILHEFGHGVGLAHPHDTGGGSLILSGVTSSSDTGLFDLNQGVYTVLSYNDAWVAGPVGRSPSGNYGFSGTLAAIDFAAIEQMYGAAPATNTGNTTYTLDDTNAPGTYYSLIWDTAGTDTISYSGTRDATLDLRAATLEYEIGGGGFVSYAAGIFGGFTIAPGAIIENATGGSGNDTITGNSADNILTGGAGNDTIDGGAGTDYVVLSGTSISDYSITENANGSFTIVHNNGGADGTDTVSKVQVVRINGVDTALSATGDIFTENADTYTAGPGDDILNALGGNDTVNGGAGNDTIDGGADGDMLFGDAGNDVLLGGDGQSLTSTQAQVYRLYLANGVSRETVVNGFSNSPEFISNTEYAGEAWSITSLNGGAEGQVFRLYLATLGREPDPNGFQNWVSQLQIDGRAYLDIIPGFVNSAEFQATYGSLDDTAFVTLLYNNVLSRAPDAAGLARWTGDLANGVSRSEVVRGFAESQEHRTNTANALDTFMQNVNTVWNDTLEGGTGNDTLFGGRGADTFVFDADEDGADMVYGLESWDQIVMRDFGYADASAFAANLTQNGDDTVFSDQGVTITFTGSTVAFVTSLYAGNGAGVGARISGGEAGSGKSGSAGAGEDAIIFTDARPVPVFAEGDAELFSLTDMWDDFAFLLPDEDRTLPVSAFEANGLDMLDLHLNAGDEALIAWIDAELLWV